MKLMERDKRLFYYSLYQGESSTRDDNGNPLPLYSKAIPCKANISASYGNVQSEQFGTMLDYDKIIITDDVNCPINEQSVLFIDKAPSFNDYGKPVGDYIVRGVAKSFNYISYAVVKVEMS